MAQHGSAWGEEWNGRVLERESGPAGREGSIGTLSEMSWVTW